MANISTSAEQTPVTISRFLGLNSAEESETQLVLGEASNMLNLRITDNCKLETIEGYKNVLDEDLLSDSIFAKPTNIVSLSTVKVNDEEMLIYQRDTSVYKKVDGVETKISGDYEVDPCSYISFDDRIYILDGKEFYEYDGTDFKPVEGYVPLIAIGTLPAGGGTDYELINLLSFKRHQTFSPDGSAKDFYLREKDLESIDKVLVNSEEVKTGITLDTKNGKVTFTTAPTKAVDNIDIYWTIKDDGSRKLVTNNKYMITYGSKNDTRIFMYGDKENRNRFRYSELGGLAVRGNYFPTTNFKDEGGSNYAITGMVKHYDRLIIFKENETRYAEYDEITSIDGITTIPAIVSYPLNSSVGNIAVNQVDLLDNYPVCLNKNGIYKLVQTNVKAESNVVYISQRIQSELDKLDLTKAITVDYESKHEFWIAVGQDVYVYNYNIDVFSKLRLAHAPKCFTTFNKKLYFGCEKGLMMFDELCLTFDDETIEQKWESSYYNFGTNTRRKNVNRLYIAMKPFYSTNCDITFETDRGISAQTFNTWQILSNFNAVNFSEFSFECSNNIRPIRNKLKSKKFVFFKIKLYNNIKNTRFNVDSISLKYTIGGETK